MRVNKIEVALCPPSPGLLKNVAGATDTEELLDRRREVRQWQSSCGRQARFSYLCGRWVDAAVGIEERQRQKLMYACVPCERNVIESSRRTSYTKLI